jgi:hypothetical protein
VRAAGDNTVQRLQCALGGHIPCSGPQVRQLWRLQHTQDRRGDAAAGSTTSSTSSSQLTVDRTLAAAAAAALKDAAGAAVDAFSQPLATMGSWCAVATASGLLARTGGEMQQLAAPAAAPPAASQQ